MQWMNQPALDQRVQRGPPLVLNDADHGHHRPALIRGVRPVRLRQDAQLCPQRHVRQPHAAAVVQRFGLEKALDSLGVRQPR
eukprot:7957153-Alexandrium_andersonii.AAC.1